MGRQEITEMGLARDETIVEFTNIEPTARKNAEHCPSLLPEANVFAVVRRSNNSSTDFNFSVRERSTGRFTFMNTLCKSDF